MLSHKVKPWAMAVLIAAVPVGTYSWMLYTRPNIYEQIAEEIKRQEEADRLATGKTSLRQ